jgi:glycosyltransferase involved in cell wall biosynthesis
MDIALIMHELLVEGGGERQCVSLARALALRGHQVTLYTSAYDRTNCFPDICKDLDVVDVGRGLFPRLRKIRFLRGYLDMKRLAAKVNRRHEIWNPHHWPAQWGAVWLKRKLGGAVVWMCNDVPNLYEKAQQWRSLGMFKASLHRAYYGFDRAQNKKVDLTLLLSNWAESEFKAIYSGPTRVVRSGVDPSHFVHGADRQKIRDRFRYSSSDFVLLWLGIFMPHRRLEDAVEAVGRLKSRGFPIKLLLAGSDRSFPEYFNSLKSLTERLEVTHEVTFAGKVADEEIGDFYRACDAFVFPNENQTWGLAVLEAMACGRPVLVSRGAAVHEVLADGENALLFPARNPDAIADRIQELITQPALRARIAQQGMNLVRAKFTWEEFARQIEEVCNELLMNPKRGQIDHTTLR